MTVFNGPGIQVPEKADPIFNPIEGLADALASLGVIVAPTLHVEGGVAFGYSPGLRQIAWTSEDDVQEVATKIAELGKSVRFAALVIPKAGRVSVQTYQFWGIWVRYIAAYDCPSDQAYGRWDVLVESVDSEKTAT